MRFSPLLDLILETDPGQKSTNAPNLNIFFQSHCAVGEVYFALDPKTGITSQSEHDPWKWAQEVSEKMAVSEDSCLVFIAGPPAAMGVPLYRDLQNNQVHNCYFVTVL